MHYSTLTEIPTTRGVTEVFGGYNHNLRISDGEFYDMKNLTSNDYPVLSPRERRGIYKTPGVPQGMVAKDSLCYVDGGDFIIGEERIPMGLTVQRDADGNIIPKNLISMGAYVIIMPDKKYIEKTRICYVSRKCGGCQLMNMTYTEQLKFKQAKVVKLLGSFHRVNEIIGMDYPFHYRNKVQAAFGRTRGGEIISGVYKSSTHNIVKTEKCLIEDKKADEIILAIRKLVKDFKTFTEDCPAGIEVYYSKYDDKRRKELLEIAKVMELYPSAASDRHSEKESFVRGDEILLQKMKEAVQKRNNRT